MKIKIKTFKTIEQHENYSLNDFLREYINSLYIELNTLLSNYHSIQEHNNRNQIIEFVNIKRISMDLLEYLVKGAFHLQELNFIRTKGNECAFMGMKLAEIADHLAFLFEEMKAVIVPKHSLVYAIKSIMNPIGLIPTNILSGSDVLPNTDNLIKLENLKPEEFGFFSTKDNSANPDKNKDSCDENLSSENNNQKIIGREIENSKFGTRNIDEIHRLMRIYLLKEDIGNYELKDGILTVKSRFLEFDLVLCGNILNPEWKLFAVKTYINNKKIEEKLLKSLSSSLENIIGFIKFYEIRKDAFELFNSLGTDIGGFYKNFRYKKDELEIRGVVKENEFQCTIYKNNDTIHLKNPSYEEIKAFLINFQSNEYETNEEWNNIRKDFKVNILGSNMCLFAQNMFFAFSLNNPYLFVGKIPQTCGLKYIKL